MTTAANDLIYFGGMKKTVLIRDGYKCVKCGITNSSHLKKWMRELSVDHIDGKGRNSNIKNNDLSNLQTLCCVCHGKKDVQKDNLKCQRCNKFISTNPDKKHDCPSSKEVCKNGHPLTQHNLKIKQSAHKKQIRICKSCKSEWSKKHGAERYTKRRHFNV